MQLFETVLRGKRKMNEQISHFRFYDCRVNPPPKKNNVIYSSVSSGREKFTSVK